ncbi:MAG: hypothetical protein QGI08_09440 [Paracoccaceae bacterium]|nr:hypothetical protein [Paracoccaceae bacterium]MDP7185929.1 hypothetical protein [Paracoccaceae bacterium]
MKVDQILIYFVVENYDEMQDKFLTLFQQIAPHTSESLQKPWYRQACSFNTDVVFDFRNMDNIAIHGHPIKNHSLTATLKHDFPAK